MYRAVTWLAQSRDVAPDDEDAVGRIAEAASFSFPGFHTTKSANPPIAIDGIDATSGIRGAAVDAAVSIVAAFPRVRAALVREQRALARSQGVVMVGRDIGTVVLPDAALKVYLDAKATERARRRYDERISRGEKAEYLDILDAMEKRDRLDAERADSPLRPADDAVIIDTSGVETAAVVDKVIALAKNVGAPSALGKATS